MQSVKDHLLTLLRISNTTHLPSKPDQAAKARKWRENQNQASSLQLCQIK